MSTDEPTGLAPEHLRAVQETSWLVLELAERLQRGFALRATEFGLSGAQAKILLALRPDEGVPMRTLARSLGYDPSNLTSLADRLEERGAIERRPDPADRRIKAIVMTGEGARLQADFRRRLVGDAGVLGALSEAQLEDLRNLLRVMLARD